MKQKYYFLQRILLSFFWTVTIIYKLALLKWKKKKNQKIHLCYMENFQGTNSTSY